MPNIAVPTQSMIRFAEDRSRLRKIRNGISACGLRASMITNETSSTTEAASAPTTLVSPQCETPLGLVAALDRPNTRAASPSVLVIAPGRSNRRGFRAVSANARGAISATMMPIGTLTNSTQRQEA